MARLAATDIVLRHSEDGLRNVTNDLYVSWDHALEVAPELNDSSWVRLYPEMLVKDKIKLSGLETLLFWKFASIIRYNDMAFLFTTVHKERFCKDNSCKTKSVNDAISKLCQKRIIFKGEMQGLYFANPKYFAKGVSSKIVESKYALSRVVTKSYRISEYGLHPKKNYHSLH